MQGQGLLGPTSRFQGGGRSEDGLEEGEVGSAGRVGGAADVIANIHDRRTEFSTLSPSVSGPTRRRDGWMTAMHLPCFSGKRLGPPAFGNSGRVLAPLALFPHAMPPSAAYAEFPGARLQQCVVHTASTASTQRSLSLRCCLYCFPIRQRPERGGGGEPGGGGRRWSPNI